MRTPRQHRLDLAVARNLANCGGYLLPEDTLFSTATGAVKPPASPAEVADTLGHLAAEHRIQSVHTETGRKYSLTDEGRAFVAAYAD